MGLLALVLIVVPILEIAAVVWVAHQVGVLTMLALLVLVSVGGGWLAKRVGLDVWRRFRATLAAGDIPSGEILDGVLILVAAAMFVIPGFASDLIGLLLLLPPVRGVAKWLFWRRMRRRMIEVTERAGTRGPVRVRAVRVIDGDQGSAPRDV